MLSLAILEARRSPLVQDAGEIFHLGQDELGYLLILHNFTEFFMCLKYNLIIFTCYIYQVFHLVRIFFDKGLNLL